jgi:nuclear protein localization family protein 4
LAQGSPIFLSNQEKDKKIPVLENKKISRCNHGENERCINCMEEKAKNDPKKKMTEMEKIGAKSGLTPKCTHQPGQQCLYCMKAPEKGELKYVCQHGPGGMCPNCVGKDFIENAKHKSFDQFINEKKQRCKGTHETTSQCINCMPPSLLSYKMKKNCPNHPPFPEGVCNKCMPPNIFLNRQVYRHVDYVEFMNPEEINEFIKPWSAGFFEVQRMGYLFGYYSKDPNYPDGVRIIVEALYEPKQIGDNNSVQPLEDNNIGYVDRISDSLSFECVGWIFTSTTGKEIALNSYDIRKAARYQEEYPIIHKSGCKISRFITCVVRPNDLGECEIEAYMVSDMCQAMERDGLFDDSKDPKKMVMKKQKKK